MKKNKLSKKRILLLFLLVETLCLFFITYLTLSASFPGYKTFKAGTRWQPNPFWNGNLNTTYMLGNDFSLQRIAYSDLSLEMKKDSVGYWVNTTSGANLDVTVNRWFETTSPEVELAYTTSGSFNTRLYVGSKGQPLSVLGTSSWSWNDPYVDFTVSSPDTVQISWGAPAQSFYTFRGLFNETTGLRIYNNVTVTAYFVGAENASESFILNGTYEYEPTYKPSYFHFELGAYDRQYWLSEEEYTGSIYVFNDTNIQTYTFTFLDLAGALEDYPFVYAQYYINGTLRTVDKRKVDLENKLQLSLVNGRKYWLKIIDGSSYTFGEFLATSTTAVTLTLKGIEFPKETLLTYKFVRIYAYRQFASPNGNITIIYQDTLNMTNSVDIAFNYKNGTNAYSDTETADSFIHVWSSALNNTDYQLEVSINHERYGVYPWRQYFPRMFSDAPWGLGFLGSLPFDTAVIIPAIIILFAAGCFSRINAEVGAFMAVVVAAALAYIGWITIGPSALVVAFVLAIIMALVYAKRRIQT